MEPLDRAWSPELLVEHARFLRRLAHGLVADEHTADDLVQDTFATALKSPPRNVRSLRSWLATVLRRGAWKQARTAGRRIRRERAAARPEATPSTRELYEREQVRRRVADVVFTLDEPYRRVLMLRFYEDLPPREIARRRNIPVETVRSQIRRGLMRVRRKLDGQYGGNREAWSLALLRLPRYAPHGDPAPAARDEAGVTGRACHGAASILPASLTLVLLGGAAALWIPLGHPRPAPRRDAQAMHRIAAPSSHSPADSRETPPSRPETRGAAATATRIPLPPPAAFPPPSRPANPQPPGPSDPAAETASSDALIVRVTWEEDGSPAAGVGVLIGVPGTSFQAERLVHTDAEGMAKIGDLRAGPVMVTTDRCPRSFRVVKHRGATASRVDLSIAPGLTIRGVAVGEDGDPVSEAEIWLYAPPRAYPATTADGKGRFVIRDLKPMGRFLGARARGRGPSPPIALHPGGPEGNDTPWRLVLEGQGGCLAGEVTGEGGTAIAGAFVQVTEQGSQLDGEPGEGEPSGEQRREGEPGERQPGEGVAGLGADPSAPPSFPLLARTDESGSFELHGIAVGEARVVVRAKDHGIFESLVAVQPRQTSTIHVMLPRGATVCGIVRDASGRAISGAVVKYGTDRSSFTFSTTMSDARGVFRLADLPCGEVSLCAFHTGVGKATTELEVGEGERVRWEPVLSRGTELQGRVVDEVGHPLDGWSVRASQEDGSWRQITDTDPEGVFRLTNCPEGSLRIRVYDPGKKTRVPDVFVEGIDPHERGLEIVRNEHTRPSAFLVGRVLDRDNHPPEGAWVSISSTWGTAPPALVNRETGSFRAGPFPPGEYEMTVWTQAGLKAVDLGSRTLEAQATVDTGTTWIQHKDDGT